MSSEPEPRPPSEPSADPDPGSAPDPAGAPARTGDQATAGSTGGAAAGPSGGAAAGSTGNAAAGAPGDSPAEVPGSPTTPGGATADVPGGPTTESPGGAAAGAGETATGGTTVQRRAPWLGPRALHKPGRTETRMKDMLGALLILIPVMLLIVGVSRSCSFAPLGPTVDPSSGPVVDAPARLTEAARFGTFPLRVPDIGWRANSTDRGPVAGGGNAVRVGYVTPTGRYLSLVQSDATEENLLLSEAGGQVPPGRGTDPAAGLSWVTYRAEGGEPFRIAAARTPGSPKPVELLVTGSGSDDEFRTLAEATVRGRVLPPGGRTN